ncbi:DUF5802 family protein [Natronoarchaeum mannanilyticum]|uniref:DUF5802 family protein n=1 Tax=Natronoarchaeum mannanilyticum TaxID=926360 RepID=A0AAV3TA62_9EURY
MFEEFSSGYYFGRLYVEPFDGDRAVMQRDQHERVNEQLYASGEGVERLDAPLVMKLDERHIPVHGEPDVPRDTLAVPATVLEDVRVRNPPALKEVLLAKADRARQLLRLTGGEPTPDDGADGGHGWDPTAGY